MLQSLVSASELEAISPHAFQQKDISFSAARFSGKKLLLNFEGSSCIFSYLPINDRKYSLASVLITLSNKSVPDPTYVLSDGISYILIWMLNEPIYREEFDKVYLYQSVLNDVLKEYSPLAKSLDVTTTIPMLWTINSISAQPVSIVRSYGQEYSKEIFEALFLRSICEAEKEN